MSTLMLSEINEQPAKLKECYEYNKAVFDAIAKAFSSRNITGITLAARGSSDNACTYFKYLSEIYLGLPVSFASPSVVTLYGGKIAYKDNLVIGVSQSGQAADVLAILQRAKESGAITISITNNLDSPMAKFSDFHVFLNTGVEKSVAATKTFITQMFSLGMITAKLAGNKELEKELLGVGDSVKAVIAQRDAIGEVSKTYARSSDCYVLSRGINYCASQEAALKIQETTYVKAKAYAVSDFHHGPYAVIDHNASVIMLSSSGKSYKDSVEMIDKLQASGAFVTVMTDNKELCLKGDNGVVLPKVAESVAPFVYVVACQIFAHELALIRGVNPDSPRGLKKVTITK